MVRPGRKRREESPYVDQAARLASGLRSLREGAGMTQEQLAARARVALATLRKIETGAVGNPGYFTVLALIEALGARVDDLVI
jgi:transcriptional regulator with XRE-family HTH domain